MTDQESQLPTATAPASPPIPEVRPLDLDDIRKRVMADLPISPEEEKLLLGSIRRGYAAQFAASQSKGKPLAAATGGRKVAASASGKLSTADQFAKLGGLDALDI